MPGPLDGVRVVELAGIGPAPHACMVLGDLGADVVRIERPGADLPTVPTEQDVLARNRTVLRLDLKGADQARIWELIEHADVLVEGYRSGVAERLGISPQECLRRNPRLVFARMTGWGQEGPWSQRAGHDINYLSVTGVLHAIGTAETPVVPLNLVADFGGGSMFLVTGVLAALLERATSGRGQVIDAAMVDGASVLAQMMWSIRRVGLWQEKRATNLLDGGAPYYGIYRCADGGHVAVGALEPRFYAELLAGLGLEAKDLPDRYDTARWPELRTVFERVFLTRGRDDWAATFEGTDACVTPVLSQTEALHHPHLVARSTFTPQESAAPAPRFSRSALDPPTMPVAADSGIDEVVRRWS